jgi:hypothetical protein
MSDMEYELDEMMPASKFSSSINKVYELLETKKRVVLLRNNVPDMVVLPVQEYELMKSIVDLVEHMDIGQLIQDRHCDKTRPLDDILSDL